MSFFASFITRGSRLGRSSLLLLLPLLLGAAGPALADLPVAGGSSADRIATHASDDMPATWRYTVRPGDALQQIARDLLKPERSWVDLVQYNKLAGANAAVPGSALDIPIHWLRQQPQPARVVAVSGSVIQRNQIDNRSPPLRQGGVLNVGDQVQTLEGRATIRLADGSTIRLEPMSLLLFDRMTRFGREGMADTRLRLERGAVGTHVEPLDQEGSRFRIETPSAVAAVRGTAFRLSSEPGFSRLEVTAGQVQFGNARQQQIVNAGFAAELRHGDPIRTLPLPPRPQLSAVPATIDVLPLPISWQAVPEASAYRLNLLNRDTGAWLASEQTGDLSRSLNNLDNGNYSVEVAAVSPQGLTGQAALADFSVGLQARPAELDQPPADARIAPEQSPRFRWSFQGSSERGQVEISRRSDFSNVVASTDWSPKNQAELKRDLAPGQYYWRVVTEAGGSSVASSSIRPLVIEGALAPPEIININYVDNQVRVFWRNVTMAERYLLQLAEDPGFEAVIKEAEITENTAALRLAPGRRYYVRLRGLTDGPQQSTWGPGRELYVE